MSHEALPIVVVVVIPGVLLVVVLIVIHPDIAHLLAPRSNCQIVEAEAGVHLSQDPLGAPHLQRELARIGLGRGRLLVVYLGKKGWCLTGMVLLRPTQDRKIAFKMLCINSRTCDGCLDEFVAICESVITLFG